MYAIYADQLGCFFGGQLIGIYASPVECMGTIRELQKMRTSDTRVHTRSTHATVTPASWSSSETWRIRSHHRSLETRRTRSSLKS